MLKAKLETEYNKLKAENSKLKDQVIDNAAEITRLRNHCKVLVSDRRYEKSRYQTQVGITNRLKARLDRQNNVINVHNKIS